MLWRHKGPLLLVLSLGMLCGASGAAEIELGAIQLGIEGHVKRGHWAELVQEVTLEGETLEAVLSLASLDGDGVPVVYTGPPIVLEANKPQSLRVMVKIGPPRAPLEIRVSNAQGELLASRKLPALSAPLVHDSTSDVIAVLGDPKAFQNAAKLLNRGRADEVAIVQLSGVASLPSDSRAYDAIDRLVVVASTENPFDPVASPAINAFYQPLKSPLSNSLSTAQRQALDQWIRGGGRLIVVAGETIDSLLAEPANFKQYLPGPITGANPLKTDVALVAYSGEDLGLDSEPEEKRPKLLEVAAPSNVIALGESGSGKQDRPLCTEAPFGAGRITWILFDITQPPLDRWGGQNRMIARLLSGTAVNFETSEISSGGKMTHLGYRDLEGQLRAALDHYPNVTPIHFYWVGAALLVYLGLLGGEYFFLRSLVPRFMHFTWLVLALLVAGFAYTTIAIGSGLRGDSVRVNQLEIAEIDSLGNEKGMCWTGLFSPQTAAYDIDMSLANESDLQVRHIDLAWQALPGKGLGGIDTPTLAPSIDTSYRAQSSTATTPAALRGVPIPLASSKVLLGNWQAKRELSQDRPLSSLKRTRLFKLEGSFVNPAPVSLENAYLVHAEYLYRANKAIAAGEEISVERLQRLHLESQIVQRRTTRKGEDVSLAWSPEETDLNKIFRILSFHDAAGGRAYTMLTERMYPELDRTFAVKHGYAVLIGRSKTPISKWQLSGQDIAADVSQRASFYVVMLPVATEETN